MVDGPSADAQQSGTGSRYLVIARRYRPGDFGELIGQGHVAQALSNAIESNRVGHAYLFTGARGVGKTSCARIFAKALNCEKGPTTEPCGQCDICQSVATGEDVDVLEIDGASNRGIEEIRQLRSNINVRPSRARYKIYIIDEVHMLTQPAFNALLKTLEEPPEHVKFMFCTTDPEKMPITVLSRCQRFDFAPVKTESIQDRLAQIVKQENMEAEPEALRLLARRAAGSMRDSQSLLEQLMSFCNDKISQDDVHSMLGTARGGRLAKLGDAIATRDAAGALHLLHEAIQEGVDVGQLAEQLLCHFRDILAATLGCDPDVLMQNSPEDVTRLAELGNQLGVETMLAACQILDQAIVRMKQSTHSRTLVELALIRICQLENLDELSSLVAGAPGKAAPGKVASSGAGGAKAGVRLPPRPPTGQKKNPEIAEKLEEEPPPEPPSEPPARVEPAPAPEPVVVEDPEPTPAEPVAEEEPTASPTPQNGQKIELSDENMEKIWGDVLKQVGGFTADYASCATRTAISAPNQLVVSFPARYTLQKESCERPDRRTELEKALEAITGCRIRLDFQLIAEERVPKPHAPVVPNRRQRMREREKHPLVKRVIEVFDAEMVRFEESRRR